MILTSRYNGEQLLSNPAIKPDRRVTMISKTGPDLHKHCAPGGIRTPNLLIRRGSYVLYYCLNQHLRLQTGPLHPPVATSPSAFRVTNRSTSTTCEGGGAPFATSRLLE